MEEVVRIWALSAALIAVLVGCASPASLPTARSVSPSASPESPSAAKELPNPKGAVLDLEKDEFPYTLQGVSAGTNPTVKGDPASPGNTFLLVILKLDGTLKDRPTAMDPFLWLSAYYPGCKDVCSSPMGAAFVPKPKEEFVQGGQGQLVSWEYDTNLQPGISYYTLVYAQIPEGVDLKQVQVCPYFERKPCIDVKDLVS
ncbi:hypothetical protein [Nonomuraea sp. NPDC003804]|uniref:hypothetical protein n=1 Tax=Nonomuraea sp. NPDC003804 TaxID=3154547 RepID=UPI0033A4D9FA